MKTSHKTRVWFCISLLMLILLGSTAVFAVENNDHSKKIAVLLVVKEAIGPAAESYIQQGLQQARQRNATVVILQLDTPGGLDSAMRNIISDILASPVPVIGYVAPGGARAASAGVFILYATHLAAMAPGTNVGAATPIILGGHVDEMQHKTQSDAIAHLRSLAELRSRNIPWVQKAVQESASLSATEALKMGVIEIIAPNVDSLLTQANGKVVNINDTPRTLNTSNLTIERITEDWRTHFLSIITNPNIAYILLLVGIYGLIFEFFSPGMILPGVVGIITLLVALYALQLLPINYAGLALILCGIAFLAAEAFLPSGALGVGGIIAFVTGSIFLLQKGIPGFEIAFTVILTISAITAAFFLFVINMAVRARFRPIVIGREEIIGSVGEIVRIDEQQLWLRLQGELWQVKSTVALRCGQQVVVTKREGMILWVKPFATEHTGESQ